LLSGRDNATYKRSKAKVGETEGYVLLPDAWIQPADVGFTANAPDFETNNYDNAHWELMENAGAVFFPAGGYRIGLDYDNRSCLANIWASTSGRTLHFFSYGVEEYSENSRTILCSGQFVRLVRILQN
jgi:hypothetical protein